ncbi:MAG: CHAT domain-containing protein [Caldilineaceae bacterium]
MNKLRILFLAANPSDLVHLQIDEEIRSITNKLRASDLRDRIEIVTAFAARSDDLLQSFNEHKPHIVHFSGHGNDAGELMFVGDSGQPEPVSQRAILELFRVLHQECRVVLLNACYSLEQAQAIASVVDCAIGMKAELIDEAAILFAASFYRAIGFGHSIQNAFDQGRAALLLKGIPLEDAPTLLVKTGVDANNILLVSDQSTESPYLPPLVSKPELYDPGALYTVTAVTQEEPALQLRIPRFRSDCVVFTLSVTNPNLIDMGIQQLFVDVLSYRAVNIIDETGGLLGGVPFRRYACLLAPQAGQYRCQALSAEYDYIRLRNGEMEEFLVNVQVEQAGVYAIKIGFHYTIGGEQRALLCHNTAYQAYFSADVGQSRLDRWRASDWPRSWVGAHRGQWNHADWEALLNDLRQSIYWPMESREVGLVLEELKREWHARYG